MINLEFIEDPSTGRSKNLMIGSLIGYGVSLFLGVLIISIAETNENPFVVTILYLISFVWYYLYIIAISLTLGLSIIYISLKCLKK